MRKLVTSGATGFAMFVLMTLQPTTAGATPITSANAGLFSYDIFLPDDITPGTNAFSVANFTGFDALAPDFPLLDPVTFTSLQLVVTDQSSTSYLIADVGAGLNTTLATGAPPVELQFPSTTLFASAVLSGNVAVKAYKYDDGAGNVGLFTPTGSFIVTLLASPGDSLIAGVDFGVIALDGTFEPQVPTDTEPVPEPGTLALVGTGIVAALRARRKRTRTSAPLLSPEV